MQGPLTVRPVQVKEVRGVNTRPSTAIDGQLKTVTGNDHEQFN